MTNATQPKPNPDPLPAVLVYGTPGGPALTQASWFRADDREALMAAAETLKFSVIELHTDADRSLAAGAHEGVLKGSGRMIVGSVSAEVYRRIEEHARKAAAGASKPENATSTMAEQIMNTGAPEPPHASIGAPVPATGKQDSAGSREALRIGARVLAAYWNEKREFEGFWLAIVKRIEPEEYTLEWFESPDIHRSRAGPRTSPFRILSSASRASKDKRLRKLNGAACGSPLFVPRMPLNQTRPHNPTSRDKPMTSTTVTTAERIRALNDAFRRTFVGGMLMITAGVEAMPVEQRRSLLAKVRSFEAFGEDNDPHGEHDFGAVDEGGVRYFWKVEYYDRATEFGSPDPTDPALTTRVLTIVRADEY